MGSILAFKEATRGGAKKKAIHQNRAKNKQAKVIEIKLKQAAKTPCLTEKQREQIVINYRMKARKLARSILRKWHARMDLQEVDSIVDLSLCESAKRFNPKLGASFMTFLFYHLRGNLIRAVSAAANSNLIPLLESEGLFAQNENGDSELHVNVINAIEVAEALNGNDFPLPDELVYKRELIEISRVACEKLDNLAREVISRIYIQGQQLIDIANSLGYSRCHISRVKKKALETLYQDMSSSIGLPAGSKRPDYDDESTSKAARSRPAIKTIHRRKPRSKKSSLTLLKPELRTH